ncbi:MAG: carboxyltransferase domain-containing protein, partial [candidate division NC10 bacterium]|nr:carboxyltransferase domain-containing protein [candidate division NC10 bacterium]
MPSRSSPWRAWLPRFLPAGDAALTVEFGNRIAIPLNRKVRALAVALEQAGVPGVVEVVPTYRSLTI